MPKLSQSLSKYDLSFLRIIARFWGFDQPLKEKKTAIEQLTTWMTNSENLHRVLQSLSLDARLALEELVAHQGRLSIAGFKRKYGEIRHVGAGKRDREAIFLSPMNASESLWFHALIFQDFFEGEQGIEEFIYIPNDLLPAIPFASSTEPPRFGAILPPEQVDLVCTVQDYLLDDICTCLAWLRMGKFIPKRLTALKNYLIISKEHFIDLPLPLKPEFLMAILSDAGILDSSGSPLPEPTRDFLSLPRGEAIKLLYETWLKTSSINELKLLESLECLGEWENDPVATRHFLIDQLRSLQSTCWYELDSFIDYIHDHFPDFQRPGGNYEVWLIRRRSDGKFLKGFESWHSVEGELLRFLLTGPILWFGIIELGRKRQDSSSYIFRIAQQGKALLQNQSMKTDLAIEEKIQVHPTGIILIPRRFPPSMRYQISRFCEWEGYKNGYYHYRITPKVLHQAQRKRLEPQQLIRLLQKYCENLPPNLIQAIRRWITHSTEIQVQRLTILRVRSPEILDKIKKSHSSKYLQQILTPTTAVVIAGQEKNLAEQLLALGFLTEIDLSLQTERESDDVK